jgi:hypothetical protein
MADATWPPRWTTSHFKARGSLKVKRTLERAPRKAKEEKAKTDVRKADGYCRFPLCGCKKYQLAKHVAHLEHKGAGGNPAGERSEPKKMITLCAARHRENSISLDRKTVRIEPLTAQGTRGPCRFLIDVRVLREPAWTCRWFEVARETARHQFAPLSLEQRRLLEQLAEMKQ